MNPPIIEEYRFFLRREDAALFHRISPVQLQPLAHCRDIVHGVIYTNHLFNDNTFLHNFRQAHYRVRKVPQGEAQQAVEYLMIKRTDAAGKYATGIVHQGEKGLVEICPQREREKLNEVLEIPPRSKSIVVSALFGDLTSALQRGYAFASKLFITAKKGEIYNPDLLK